MNDPGYQDVQSMPVVRCCGDQSSMGSAVNSAHDATGIVRPGTIAPDRVMRGALSLEPCLY